MEKNNIQSEPITIGLDASNLRQGGGVTHLIGLISVLDPKTHNFKKLIIWGNKKILSRLKNAEWLIKVYPKDLQMGLIFRISWQRFKLNNSATYYNCDILLVPGGNFSCSFKPIVTMSRIVLNAL